MNFPIGESQTLSIGSLSLVLDRNDFDADQDNVIGYQRIENIQQQSVVSKSLHGTSLIKGVCFPTEFIFKWNLQLSTAKMWQLKAIYDEQQYRCKNQVSSCQVRLWDKRIIFMGRNPRNRAKVGDMVFYPAPVGYSFFWAQFNIMLEIGTDFSNLFLKYNQEDLLFKVKLVATEMDIVPLAEDIQ